MTLLPNWLRGELYRRGDLHQVWGGPPQGYLSPLPTHPLTMLFIPETQRGGWGADGFYHLTLAGDGSTELLGPQAVDGVLPPQRALALFFREPSGSYRFQGFMDCLRYRWRKSPALGGSPCLTLQLVAWGAAPRLSPGGSMGLAVPEELEPLRRWAYAGQGTPPASLTAYREQSQRVAAYVQARAGGFCEGCGVPAPFADDAGNPYLELHQLRRLHDSSADPPDRAVALCPNCHRWAHTTGQGRAANRGWGAEVTALERAASAGEFKRVVAAILHDAAGRIYIAQRKYGPLAGRWEFPGGKVEGDETLLDALHREIQEELGTTLHQVRPFGRADYAYPEFYLRLFAFTAIPRGRPRPEEHAAARWVSPHQLREVSWAPADLPLVAALEQGGLQGSLASHPLYPPTGPAPSRD